MERNSPPDTGNFIPLRERCGGAEKALFRVHGPLGEVGAAVAGGAGSAALEKPFQEAVRRASPGMPPAPQSSSAAGPGAGEPRCKRRGTRFNRAARPSAGTGGLPPICGTRYMRRLPALIRLSGGLRRSGWTLLPSCGKRLSLEHGIPSDPGTDIFPREEISGNFGKNSFPISVRHFCRDGLAPLPFSLPDAWILRRFRRKFPGDGQSEWNGRRHPVLFPFSRSRHGG